MYNFKSINKQTNNIIISIITILSIIIILWFCVSYLLILNIIVYFTWNCSGSLSLIHKTILFGVLMLISH